jgi:hypothetical protein
MMCKPFKKLRLLLVENDMEQADLAKKLNRCLMYVNKRLNAKEPWSQDDQYKIMDWFKWPYEQMYELFPKNGGAA